MASEPAAVPDAARRPARCSRATGPTTDGRVTSGPRTRSCEDLGDGADAAARDADLLPPRAEAMLGLYERGPPGGAALRVPLRGDADVRAHRAVRAHGRARPPTSSRRRCTRSRTGAAGRSRCGRSGRRASCARTSSTRTTCRSRSRPTTSGRCSGTGGRRRAAARVPAVRDVEVLGRGGPGGRRGGRSRSADAVPARAAGLARTELQLNSIGDEVCRPAYRELLIAYLEPHRRRARRGLPNRLRDEPAAGPRLQGGRLPEPFVLDAPLISDHLCDPCAEHFAAVRSALEAAGVAYELDPTAGARPRLLHADGVRVRLGGAVAGAGDDLRRRPLRRPGGGARRPAHARRRLRDGPGPGAAGDGGGGRAAAPTPRRRVLRRDGRPRDRRRRRRPRVGAAGRRRARRRAVRGAAPEGAAEDGRPRRRRVRRHRRREGAGGRRRHAARGSSTACRRRCRRRMWCHGSPASTDGRTDRARAQHPAHHDAHARLRRAPLGPRRRGRDPVRLGRAPPRPRGRDLHRPARPRGRRAGGVPPRGRARGPHGRAGPPRGGRGARDGRRPRTPRRHAQPEPRDGRDRGPGDRPRGPVGLGDAAVPDRGPRRGVRGAAAEVPLPRPAPSGDDRRCSPPGTASCTSSASIWRSAGSSTSRRRSSLDPRPRVRATSSCRHGCSAARSTPCRSRRSS